MSCALLCYVPLSHTYGYQCVLMLNVLMLNWLTVRLLTCLQTATTMSFGSRLAACWSLAHRKLQAIEQAELLSPPCTALQFMLTSLKHCIANDL